MMINISSIIKTNGASLDVEYLSSMDDLNFEHDEFVFNQPISFKGRLENIMGIIKLNGHIHTQYSGACYRCLKELSGELEIDVEEEFVKADDNTDVEAYTFEGNKIETDKLIKDYIILNLPMKQICSNQCKGLCANCGTDLNEGTCSCEQNQVNPQMDKLKNFFKQ